MASTKPAPVPKASYTRRIVRDHLASILNDLNERNKFHAIPNIYNPLPSEGPFQWDRNNLPSRPDWPSQDLPKDVKVCIVGAGVSGLYTALILDHLGIPYDLLEASSRAGGRVLTHYFSPKKHDYFDIGAMRFPVIPPMDRTFDLFKRTEVPLREYYLSGPNTPKRYNGITVFDVTNAGHDPFKVGQSYGGAVPDEMVKSASEILEKAYGPYKKAIAADDDASFEKLAEVDDLTTREYLRDKMGLDYHTIQWLEQTDNSTGAFDNAFSECVLDSIAFDYGPEEEFWQCVEGGTTLVIDAMLKMVKTKPTYNQRVTRIALDRSRRGEDKMVVTSNYGETSTYATVINTTTLACLQRVDTNDLELSSTARVALRTLKYDMSTKVAIKFTHPWWITECGITRGGVANTDLPIRVCVYPSYNTEDDPNSPSILLCTYTWSQDATRIGSLVNNDSPRGEEELKNLMLYNLARLHSTDKTFDKMYDLIKHAYITHHGFDWAMDDYSSGAFALFGPGQFRWLYPHLIRPHADARFHIVGEAASANHAWIVGSLESAYRGVWLFLERYHCYDLQKKMEEEFKSIPELDTGREGFAHLLVMLGMMKPEHLAKTEMEHDKKTMSKVHNKRRA